MNTLRKSDENIIISGNWNTPKLGYDELLDLIIYHAYRAESSYFSISYPLVNICIRILQTDQNAGRKQLSEKFMVFSFKFFIKKWVMRNYNRIRKYFNMSIKGKHQDMSDVYQELYIYFFDLIHDFNMEGDVFFVVFLNKYLFYWLNNRFKINKKEKIHQVSLESVVVEAGDSTAPVTFLEALHVIQATPIANGGSEKNMEEYMIDRIIIEDFEINIINNPEHFKSQESQDIYKNVYVYFFVDGRTNKSDLARQMGISQQKVRYYLDKIFRMFNSYLR